MPPERKKLLLRLDPAVHDALARWAADEFRSTNAQIEYLLRRALADAGRLPGGVGRMRGPGRPSATPEPEEE
ncbi:hypothetical protein GCM10009682_51090 [Luedemannella flava]|uniref:Toxin-antitoxin system HicB family antitoxin n=1 Tax=Luedemannella flava TaxID=349316 RepID=A0ABN2MGY2_9ACTN